jgi:hypothetical protein
MSARLRLLAVLIMTLACTAWGYQQVGVASRVTLNKILISFKTATSSEGEQPLVQARTLVENDVVHRWIFNWDGSLFFGYDFTVEAVPNTSQFMVAVRPLSQEGLEKFQAGGMGGVAVARGGGGGGRGMASAQARGASPEAGRPPVQPALSLSPSQSPPPQRIEDGDTISIDLLTNPQTGTRIFDLIKVASSNRIMSRNESPLEARAAALTRAPDTTTIWTFGFDVIVDGKLTATVNGGCTGKFVFFSLNSPQRFILSTQPQEGYAFVNAGVIDGNSIRFQWNGSNYELLCSEPVLEGGAKAGLWLLVDTGPTPAAAAQGAVVGAGGGGRGAAVGARARGAGVGSGTGAGGGGVAGAGGSAAIAEMLALRMQRGVTCGAAGSIEALVSRK